MRRNSGRSTTSPSRKLWPTRKYPGDYCLASMISRQISTRITCLSWSKSRSTQHPCPTITSSTDSQCITSSLTKCLLRTTSLRTLSMHVFGFSVLAVLTAWELEALTVLDAIRFNGSRTRAISYLLTISGEEMVSRSCTMVCKSICIWLTITLSTARNVTCPDARPSTPAYSQRLNRRAPFNGFQLAVIIAVTFGEPTLVLILAMDERLDSHPLDQSSSSEVPASSIFPSTKTQEP